MKMRLIILLVCAAIVPRSGPLPACLWDEVIASWISSPEIPPSLAGPVKTVMPPCDDSQDEISSQSAQQQSLGSDAQSSRLVHPAIANPLIFASIANVPLVHCCLPSCDSALGARSPPLPVPAAQNLPLLI